jgi:hypothetical protein
MRYAWVVLIVGEGHYDSFTFDNETEARAKYVAEVTFQESEYGSQAWVRLLNTIESNRS